MAWPNKVKCLASNKIYDFNQEGIPLDFAWYIGDSDVYLTKISKQDLISGFYFSWDDDGEFDWKKVTITKSKPEKTTQDPLKPKENLCQWRHSWKKYIGFREVYDYCENCGKKREKNE